MKYRRGISGWISVGTVACVLAVMALGGGSASAADGDTFFLAKKKNTFVSFAVRAGSDEASQLMYGAENIPCRGGVPGPTAMAKLDGSAPITDGTFHDSWAHGTPDYGGLKGQVDSDSATGKLRLKIKIKKPGRELGVCNSGRRDWSAKSVSEQRWIAAREERFGVSR